MDKHLALTLVVAPARIILELGDIITASLYHDIFCDDTVLCTDG